MPILSYKNHLKFGYNREWFRLRQSPDDVFTIEYGICEREPKDFKSESINAARLIGQEADGTIHVLYSGGADSEVAMLSFLEAKVPVTAAIMRFKDDLNVHDISYAVRFCEKHGVPYRFYDLDIIEFLNDRVTDYTGPTRCTAPMMAATMWLVDQIDGFPVLGQGECLLMRPDMIKQHRLPQARIHSYHDVEFTPPQWALQESEMINAWYRHFLIRDRNGVPGFHQYTPEQILSYLQDAGVVQMMHNPQNITSEARKLAMYQQHFIMDSRPKFTGYEKVSELAAKERQKHLLRHADAHNFVLFDYSRLKSDMAKYSKTEEATMPYTTKAVTKWNDPAASDEEQVAKVRALLTSDLLSESFDPAGVFQLRRDATASGDLLARGSVVSPDGKEISTTSVWKSKAAYTRFSNHPDMVAYLKAMNDHGWHVTISQV